MGSQAQLRIDLLTAEEFFQLAPEGRTALIQGEIVTMSPSGSRHGRFTSRISHFLESYLETTPIGEAFGAETGFILSRGPDTVRGPDAAFVRKERIPEGGEPDGFFPGAPDLAIEVLSPGDTWSEIEEKVEEYLSAGTVEVWLVDPRRKTVHIISGRPAVFRLLRQHDVLTSDMLPGFSLPLERIFRSSQDAPREA